MGGGGGRGRGGRLAGESVSCPASPLGIRCPSRPSCPVLSSPPLSSPGSSWPSCCGAAGGNFLVAGTPGAGDAGWVRFVCRSRPLSAGTVTAAVQPSADGHCPPRNAIKKRARRARFPAAGLGFALAAPSRGTWCWWGTSQDFKGAQHPPRGALGVKITQPQPR